MSRGMPFLLVVAVAACGLAAGQDAPKAADPQAQSKPESPAPADAKAQQGDPRVLILKSPEMPVTPQTAPQLRAVDLEKRAKLSDDTRLKLVQLIDAEFVHVRKYFPLGDKSMVINPQGQVSPSDPALFQQIQARGAAAKLGDKVQITSIAFHEKSISLQINGGPKRKSKWYQHVSVGVGGPGGGVTPIDANEAQATGAELTLQFNKQVPEMTADELRKLLSPVLDFSAKSAAEVYVDTLPPKIKQAIKNHEVLVGMNRDMVVMAKDRPPQKVREKDDKGKEYEEWIYGAPPQDVVFVRLIGDEVTQVKIARVGGQITVKTEKEVDVKDGVASLAVLKASNSPQDAQQEEQSQQPTRRPTLRREGEQPDDAPEVLRAPNGQTQPQQEHSDEPEWGTNGKQPTQGGQEPPPNGQQPPSQDQQKPPQ
jgi:hypothetical protein